MRNDITSLLQPHAPQSLSKGQAQRNVQASDKAQPAEASIATLTDRVTLSDSARRLQLSDSATANSVAPSISKEAGSAQSAEKPKVHSDPNRLPAAGSAQRPSPAMANMLEAFFTTADMESFDQNSDLNADGVINFHDLAALRDREAGVSPPDDPVLGMTESFLTTKGSEGYDAASDLNEDGIINFHDLAILRAKIEEA